MTRVLLALGALLAAAVTTRALLRLLIPSAPLTRKNYRGIAVATGLGITVQAGLLAGAALVALAYAIAPAQTGRAFSPSGVVFALALALGFGLLGLFDDLTGAADPAAPRGLRGHLSALRAGRMTGGALKMLGGGTLALTVAAPLSRGFGWTLANALVIALAANLFNSLDVRPGRALKSFLFAAVPLTVLGGAIRPVLAAAAGAAVAFLREDLRERAMLGDAGSNALGALVGFGVVVLAPNWLVLSVLGLLAILTLVAEGPTLSAMIAKIPPLRAFDQAGRVRDVPELPA